MSALTYWEESRLEKKPEHVPDVSTDIELSMNKFLLKDLEDGEDNMLKTEKIVVPPLNPLMLHAITLHRHENNILDMMKLVGVTKNQEKIDFQVPEFDQKENLSVKNNLNFSKQDFRNSDTGLEVGVCELSKTVVRQILTKSVATIFAHIGYERSHESVLDVLTDVLQDFFKKITYQVKVAIEDQENYQYSGFPHVIEKVLTEMGLGGVKALDDYYQSRVIKYVNVLENRCRHLNEEYSALLVPKSPSPVDKVNKVVRVKVEEEDVVEVENTEVHFSTIDGDVNFSILETGYQLLKSLEAEANSQGMVDSVEDIAVTESPGVASLPTDDISHLSPYNDKKKFK